jgi:hypothetical protein
MESTAIQSEGGGRASIFALAFTVVAAVAGVAFFAGWLIGRIVS